jgi:hypothetical protein
MASKFFLCMKIKMEEGDMWHYNHLEHCIQALFYGLLT